MDMLRLGSGAYRRARGSHLQYVKPPRKRRGTKASPAAIFNMQLGLLVRRATNGDNYRDASGALLRGYSEAGIAALRQRYEDAREYLGNAARANEDYRAFIGDAANRPDGWAAFVEAQVNCFFESDPRRFVPGAAFVSTRYNADNDRYTHYRGKVTGNDNGKVQAIIAAWPNCCVLASFDNGEALTVQKCPECGTADDEAEDPITYEHDEWDTYEWSAPHEFEGCAIEARDDDDDGNESDTLSL
jgi:hypothetical protein